jgi:hypothetical protein
MFVSYFFSVARQNNIGVRPHCNFGREALLKYIKHLLMFSYASAARLFAEIENTAPCWSLEVIRRKITANAI